MQFQIRHIGSVQTKLTTNCLLPSIDTECARERVPLGGNTDQVASSTASEGCHACDRDAVFHAAAYQLEHPAPAAPSDSSSSSSSSRETAASNESRCTATEQATTTATPAGPLYHGSCSIFSCSVNDSAAKDGSDGEAVRLPKKRSDNAGSEAGRQSARAVSQGQEDVADRRPGCAASHFPGVFDMICVPRFFFSPSTTTPLDDAVDLTPCLLLSCTDGSLRVLDASTLAPTIAPITGIHASMLTSATPFYGPASWPSSAAAAPPPSDDEGVAAVAPYCLCTAHTGAVVVCDIAERHVVAELEGHEYDAWCSSLLLTGGWREANTAAAPSATADCLLASGGDDGYLKLYDLRLSGSRATQKMRFGAGVVSITPVLDTRTMAGDAAAAAVAYSTPYLLVGSYDESISLVDMRYPRRPVAQRGGLGGGVWRTSRCLYSTPALPGGGGANRQLLLGGGDGRWVSHRNTLVLPLMHGGAALLPYDCYAASEEVFAVGGAGLTSFYSTDHHDPAAKDSASQLPISGRDRLSEDTLIYDVAVVARSCRCPPAVVEREREMVVATTSFYEKRIDLWSVAAPPPLF